VDGQAHRRGALAHVRGALPPGSCQSVAAPGGMESAAAHRARDAARRGGHPALAGGALARPSKKALEEGYTIVWVDESGFYLLPLAVRTWAPKGETPVLRVKLTHDHLSAISGITLDGRLFMQVREDAFDTEGVVGFLRVLRRKIRGKVMVIWDGSPIHKGQPIKDYLARGAAKRLHLERLPGYAPDLNPEEGIWNYLKRVELKNRCCADLAELRLELRRAKERLRHKRHIIRSCSTHCGYSV
jgi:transposase